MSSPRITIWKNPGVWPKLTRDPYAPSSMDAPMRETDEDGSRRLLYHGEEIVSLPPLGLSLGQGGIVLTYFTFGDGQSRSFIIHGGEDEDKWLRDSVRPKGKRI